MFHESQKFTQWWVWALLLAIAAVPAYGLYQQVIAGEPFGNVPLSNAGLLVFFGVLVFTAGLFYIMELRTHADVDRILIRFFPFTKREIDWRDVAQAKVIDYGFVGGWGIRMGTKYGTVYNTRGKMGLALKLKDGKKLCVGTQKPDELRRAVAAIQARHAQSD